MAKIKKKGQSGAAKAYVTRTAATKKLQISLADFRRLCILKGIFPREPRSRKKANKGSNVPTTFYYTKDIAYLAHEPVLRKLREHKAFAKRLSRALGRGGWSSAKSLDENKPTYTLDHIVKERYPTFTDALRDIDDALCLVALFSSLPSTAQLPPSLIENCSRLMTEWQLYVAHEHDLRKIFISIKGIYLQADVQGEQVTWLIPHAFAQVIPSDVDVRVMLTFLELYQTLLGFVLFKLYADAGLAYPPQLDAEKDAKAAGDAAYSLEPIRSGAEADGTTATASAKAVRTAIRAIESAQDIAGPAAEEGPEAREPPVDASASEDFQPHPSTEPLPTLQTLSELPSDPRRTLFADCVVFISREVPRALFSFILRACGARLVGWPATSGAGSSLSEDDPRVTHVIVDRPLVEGQERRTDRKYVQPQWVADCVNSGTLLLEAKYAQGELLPPHLSPFNAEGRGAYEPEPLVRPENTDTVDTEIAVAEEASAGELDEDEEESDAEPDATETIEVATTNVDTSDPAALRAAELAAESAGVDFDTFTANVEKSAKKSKKMSAKAPNSMSVEDVEKDMRKMLMSNKKRKLYEKMKFGERKQIAERALLQSKKDKIRKEQRKKSKAIS